MDFGRASTLVESIEDAATAVAAVRLLGALQYTGIAEVEFKRDPRDDRLKLLDINPRVWGWHSLCGAAGVDYPYLLWLMTVDEPVPVTKAVAGVRWVRMSTDVPTVLREVLLGRMSVREYLRSIRPPRASAIYASDDPLPGILEIPLLVYLACKRAFSRGWNRLNALANYLGCEVLGRGICRSTQASAQAHPKANFREPAEGRESAAKG
jgi:predicted ATP-grasp superfamily ATP-dependent carboligase